MKANLHLVLSTAIFFVLFCGMAQQSEWQEIKRKPAAVQPVKHHFALNEKVFMGGLRFEDKQNNKKKRVRFPDEEGKIIEYWVEEASVMHPDLAKRFPRIKSYVGWSKDNTKKIRFSTSHRGVQAMIQKLDVQKSIFIQKESRSSDIYEVYEGKQSSSSAFCKTVVATINEKSNSAWSEKLVDDQTLRTYRLAVSASGDYTVYHGGTVEDALAAINATVNRINEVFERDLSIQLQLIANNDAVIFTDPDVDPYSSGSDLLGEVQNELETTIGEANFDIGHLFHRDADNGNAGGIGTVCSSIKGRAFSSAENPETDLYDLDYVAHEMGHQFGANHTWSFDNEGTGVQAEPGSGTTIMGYAGITGSNNVAPNGDDYFHHNSIQQITAYIKNQSCSVDSGFTNSAPVIIENLDYVIPAGTAFVLTGSATDPDAGDNLTYTWEQIDNGVVSNETFGPDNPIGANFRSLPPSTEPSRYFPQLSSVAVGQLEQSSPNINSTWETVSNINRDMNFALTVRDNAVGGGQIATEEVLVTVVDTGSPFSISSQSEMLQQYPAGSLIEVIWDVAGTDQSPINVVTVDFFLSLDGGLSFPIELASDVPNDGSAQIQLPGNTTAEGRIMIKSSNSIFFAVNAQNFEVTASDFILDFDALEFEVCKPDDLTVNFNYETFGGFAGTTVLTANLPAGATGTFTPSSVTSSGTAVSFALNNISNLDVGSYPIQVIGTSGGVVSQVELTLGVFDSNLSDVVLTAPLDLAIGTRVNPQFEWEDGDNFNSFEIEIATDDAFANIVESGVSSANSYQSTNLESSTTYFWRVKPINNCAQGNFSAPFSFSTVLIDCLTVTAEGLPINISSGAPSTVSTSITVTQDLPISEIELALELDHTYLGDLVLSLTSPEGTRVLLTSNTCGPLNNINAVFADDGSALVCSGDPAISGTVKPLSSFSAFKGETTEGEWLLEVQDVASGDGGAVRDFSITFCVEGTFRPDDDEDGVFDDGDDLCLGTPKGAQVTTDGCQVFRFEPNNFGIEVNSESCIGNDDGEISILVVDTTLTYEATLTTVGFNDTASFTENATFTNLSAGNYTLCLVATDGLNNYEESCYTLIIGEPDELQASAIFNEQNLTATVNLTGGSIYNVELNGVVTQTRDSEITLNLINGRNEVRVFTNLSCQGEYKEVFLVNAGLMLAPNPTQDFATLFLNDFRGEFSMQLFTHEGKLVTSRKANTNSGRIDIPLRQYPTGVYFLKITGNRLNETFKILKR